MRLELRTVAMVALAAAALFAGCANHAPTFFPIGNKNVETNTTLDFLVEAIDEDGDTLEFSMQGKPPAAEFSKVSDNSARFTWTPIASDAGPDGSGKDYNVVFKVTDGLDTASEAITIYVTLGGAGTGAPVFITPSDYTLDLNRKQSISFNIEVRDADSTDVTLRVVENIPGGNFQTTSGSKLASYEWTPTEQQVGERPVWSLRVGAKDADNPEVFQDITILIKGGQEKCEGTAPVLEHDALPDQRGDQDYPVSVVASDAESEVTAVALYWMVENIDESFLKSSMTEAGGGTWTGSIPNPGLKEGETADVTYYICATDNDDASGTDCDMRGCVPEDGRFVFTAYAAGNVDCEDDLFEGSEGNDNSGNASKVELDSNGESVLESLKICPGNVDWYQIEVPEASYWAGALLAYTEANGVLGMDLYDADGTTMLKAGEAEEDQVMVVSDVFNAPQTVYLNVYGSTSEVENRYSLLVVVEEYVPCDDDIYEPNNVPADAEPIVEDVYTDLTCCGDPDWYSIALNEGDKLEVELEFITAEGDLDLWIFDQDTVDNAETFSCDNALACSTTETDDELAVVESIPADGTYYIAMGPYQGAKNTYHMLVVVTPQATQCTEDGNEPNDVPADAVEADVDVPMPGLMLCPNNEDWYKTLMYKDETIIIDISFTHASGDLDMKLYDPDVTPDNLLDHQVAAALSTDDDEHIEYVIPADGYYYTRIFGYQLEDGNAYDLTVSYE